MPPPGGGRKRGAVAVLPWIFAIVAIMTLDEEKKAARAEAASRRREAFAADPDAPDRLAEKVATNAVRLGLGRGVRVSVYWPMRDELDVRPLMMRLHGLGCVVALPVVIGRDRPLLFRRWMPGMTLQAGLFGLSEPDGAAAEVAPRVLFVPLLGFDRAGNRIGWGAGFYDRTLAALRGAGPVVAVGVAFAAQELARVPAGDRDEPLDWIATERDLIKPRG